MKKLLLPILALCSCTVAQAANEIISIRTANIDLVLKVGPNNRLYQVYLGEKLLNEKDFQNLPWDVYAASDGSVCQRGI